MSKNGNWKRELADIVKVHNDRHAHGHKGVSSATMGDRRHGLFRCFSQLRSLGYQLAPTGLGGRHIAALVKFWTCHPEAANLPGCRQGLCKPLTVPHSPAYIQKQLSFLRVFANWIGKPGLVASATAYVDDPALVQRHTATERDKSWSGNDVDVAALVAKIDAADPFVGLQLELMLAFGLRRKEAVMFQPALAQVSRMAVQDQFGFDPGTDWLSFIRVTRGTKGGRLRFTAVRTEYQQRVLERAKLLAPHQNSNVGRPGLSLKQALDRFSYVLRSAGVTGKLLGVTGHGLRHQFAADLYFELARVEAPVRGGALANKATMDAAYLEVARQLGHNRRSITGAYLGAPALCGSNDQGITDPGGAAPPP
jgi:integrase